MANPISGDELEFVKAIEEYKKQNSKTFLSWTEVLSIVRDLGYRKSEVHRRKKSTAKA